ncbi:FAD-dependent oxidoreductase [Epibacterium sp. SM1979]|uniref:FAD-dependent oxidoreductase n=1 Tax=Tritonibacter litoralis TaxID=2662264 RepID=A0A843YMB3_9RHOB|nr:FAD-binding oxidoreductase [Tritonibacter litoralis]MQQ10349.1 FAD-dependent oxidoreductase [Tritonibacter litoralis]
MAMADVTVRGAGIFGLSIAWRCVQIGARVQIIDPFGAGAGSSGGLVGALAPHVPENWNPKKAFQLDSLLMAERFWHEVEAVGGTSAGYGRTGRLQPIQDARTLELAHARATSAKALWQDHATWSVIPVTEVGDWAPPSATGYLIHDTLSARMFPRRAGAALVAALAAKGVAVSPDGDDQGNVVHATGYLGLQALSEDLEKPVGNGVKGQSLLLDFDAHDKPQLYADSLHIIPHADGTTAIGSTSERAFDDPASTDAQLDDIHARAIAAMPQLATARVLERWAGVRPRAKTRAPMIGPWPDRAGHFVANGGFKIGFGMAPKIADVMADLILNSHDTIPQGFRVTDNL